MQNPQQINSIYVITGVSKSVHGNMQNYDAIKKVRYIRQICRCISYLPIIIQNNIVF